MRIGLVSGDGLPVSGLLTVFRNVLNLGVGMGIVDPYVPADLGFSWRPDKPSFFPDGQGEIHAPSWMQVAPHYIRADSRELALALTRLRNGIAEFESASPGDKAALKTSFATLQSMYYKQFTRWLDEIAVDWIFAVNMTLPDAAPATAALHEAAGRYFSAKESGGVVFWDHDLFGSCAVPNSDTGGRLYPPTPNELTPLPRARNQNRWIVVSRALEYEGSRYPTDLSPIAVPNVVPRSGQGALQARHLEFLAENDLQPSRPVLLSPVRVSRVKGVDLSIRVLAEMLRLAEVHAARRPYLLIFGSLDEEPSYAQEVMRVAYELNVAGDVVFLNGVPLTSERDSGGHWRLDECDLLQIAAWTRGGIIFTPGFPDIESVGLGPALSALAGIPFLVTRYDAFESVYGPSITYTGLEPTNSGIAAAAREFMSILHRFRNGEFTLLESLRRNETIVGKRFPDDGWRQQWRQLSRVTSGLR